MPREMLCLIDNTESATPELSDQNIVTNSIRYRNLDALGFRDIEIIGTPCGQRSHGGLQKNLAD